MHCLWKNHSTWIQRTHQLGAVSQLITDNHAVAGGCQNKNIEMFCVWLSLILTFCFAWRRSSITKKDRKKATSRSSRFESQYPYQKLFASVQSPAPQISRMEVLRDTYVNDNPAQGKSSWPGSSGASSRVDMQKRCVRRADRS